MPIMETCVFAFIHGTKTKLFETQCANGSEDQIYQLHIDETERLLDMVRDLKDRNKLMRAKIRHLNQLIGKGCCHKIHHK